MGIIFNLSVTPLHDWLIVQLIVLPSSWLWSGNVSSCSSAVWQLILLCQYCLFLGAEGWRKFPKLLRWIQHPDHYHGLYICSSYCNRKLLSAWWSWWNEWNSLSSILRIPLTEWNNLFSPDRLLTTGSVLIFWYACIHNFDNYKAVGVVRLQPLHTVLVSQSQCYVMTEYCNVTLSFVRVIFILLRKSNKVEWRG